MGGFCSFDTFSFLCQKQKHLGKLVGECILPREQQIRLNPCTDGGPGDKGEEQEMKGQMDVWQ